MLVIFCFLCLVMMSPPKKQSYEERMKKKENDTIETKLESIRKDLSSFHKALQQEDADFDTWRWAALETFRTLQKEFPFDHKLVQIEKARALKIAREAQAALNFLG